MKPRIDALTDEQAPAASATILEQLHRAIGMVPNLHRTLAHAPVALRSYVNTAKALAAGGLSPALREQIAVATAGLNHCGYCAAAHTMLGKGVGIDAAELTDNLAARSSDARVAAALTFVRVLLETRGAVTDAQLAAVREAGFTEAEIVEIVAHVGMNAFTNMFNRLAQTEVDFPSVELPGVLEEAS